MTAMPSFRFKPKTSETEIQVIMDHEKIRRAGPRFPEQIQSRRTASVHIGLRFCQDHAFFFLVSIVDRA